MLFKLFISVLILAVCEAGVSPVGEKSKTVRQKRLLFYDEDGNLVKTYKNPYSLDYIHSPEKAPFFGSFFSMLRPSTLGIPTAYMIPVSDQVIQQINSDPIYQNKLLTLPRKDLLIEPNSRCAGKRTQIPSKSCNNFLNCWDGWAFEQECPEGLLFAKEGYCDYPHNVDCSTRDNEPSQSQSGKLPLKVPAPALPVDPVAPVAPPAPNPPLAPVASPAPNLPPAPVVAPAQDPPLAPIPLPVPKPQPAPITPPFNFCSQDFEAFRSEQYCNEFFVCVNRSPVKFRCPADLAYNQELGICDYEYRVDCGTSTIKQDEAAQPKPACSPALSDAVSLVPAPQPSPEFSQKGPLVKPDVNVLTSSAQFSTQTWSSSHVAMSRQDAIRQLNIGQEMRQ